MTRKTDPTALPVPLLDAVAAVNGCVQACDRLDAAIDRCPFDRQQLEKEHAETSNRLAAAEAALALADRGSSGEASHLDEVNQLIVTLAAVERERHRIDARELALEAEGPRLDQELASAATVLRHEAGIFSDLLRDTISAEYRKVLPALLIARARLQALVSLGDRGVLDALSGSCLVDPAGSYAHFVGMGDQRLHPAGADLLGEQNSEADAARAALSQLLQPVVQALGAARRGPFRSLRERRTAMGYEGQRSYTISTGSNPPVAPPPPAPQKNLEAELRNYRVKSDSSGGRTRGVIADADIGGQIMRQWAEEDAR